MRHRYMSLKRTAEVWEQPEPIVIAHRVIGAVVSCHDCAWTHGTFLLPIARSRTPVVA